MSRFRHTPKYTPKNIGEPLFYGNLFYNYYIISRQKASQNIYLRLSGRLPVHRTFPAFNQSLSGRRSRPVTTLEIQIPNFR